jgi:S-DNA-T family DNA segregation ATPase FtsK/SpoIIIE
MSVLGFATRLLIPAAISCDRQVYGTNSDSVVRSSTRAVHSKWARRPPPLCNAGFGLGYGRAARILDMMQRDGIIGPPDGSKPREVLKRPDWLAEVEAQVR